MEKTYKKCPKCGAVQLASYETCVYPHCNTSIVLVSPKPLKELL